MDEKGTTVALTCPYRRKPVETAEAKENQHMHAKCYVDYRISELERIVDGQRLVIQRIQRQLESAWQGAA
jgi:hypothetical protein